ncbi:unnamed protein product [Rotaria sp. Silwood2]|nr:unnamed protein product [Rotaria sp. Silwood2]
MYRLGLLLLLFNVVDAESYSSTLILSDLGTIFQPVNIIELIRTFNANTLLHCSIKCNNDVHCRTIDYDSISKQCRHFAGEISTGTIISSNSPTSTVGGIIYTPDYYLSYNKMSDQCQTSRYLVVSSSSNLCTCPTETFWNGSMCLNQLYTGSTCLSDEWCRTDLNLFCDMFYQICSPNVDSPTLKYSSIELSSTITNISTIESTFMETSAFTSSLSTSSTITNSSILINYTNVYPAPVASPNAAAQLYSVNLLMNGDGETGPCAMSINVTHPTVWSYVGTITQISYNDYEYGALDPTSPGPSDRGNCYFCGMFDAVTTMSQSIDLFPYATAIASGNVSFNLSAWLGGWTNQDDSAKVSVNFLDYAYQPVGNQTTIGPVLAADRGFTSSLIFRQNSGMIPINTRYMTVIVTLIWHSGSENDGYIDNISVKLRYS